MDNFMLLPSCGWCVNHFWFDIFWIFFLSIIILFNIQIFFFLSSVASFGISGGISSCNYYLAYHWGYTRVIQMFGEHVTYVVDRLDPIESHYFCSNNFPNSEKC